MARRRLEAFGQETFAMLRTLKACVAAAALLACAGQAHAVTFVADFTFA